MNDKDVQEQDDPTTLRTMQRNYILFEQMRGQRKWISVSHCEYYVHLWVISWLLEIKCKAKNTTVRTVSKSNRRIIETEVKSLPQSFTSLLTLLAWYNHFIVVKLVSGPTNRLSVKWCGHASGFHMWVKCQPSYLVVNRCDKECAAVLILNIIYLCFETQKLSYVLVYGQLLTKI